MKKVYYVFMAGDKKKLEVGTTSDIEKKMKKISNPEKKKLLFFDTFLNPLLAIAAGKKLKSLPDKKKFEIIEKNNPKMEDLFKYWKE
jgi:predicted GIY-YIG superfamily endonuclease